MGRGKKKMILVGGVSIFVEYRLNVKCTIIVYSYLHTFLVVTLDEFVLLW